MQWKVSDAKQTQCKTSHESMLKARYCWNIFSLPFSKICWILQKPHAPHLFVLHTHTYTHTHAVSSSFLSRHNPNSSAQKFHLSIQAGINYKTKLTHLATPSSVLSFVSTILLCFFYVTPSSAVPSDFAYDLQLSLCLSASTLSLPLKRGRGPVWVEFEEEKQKQSLLCG